MKKNIRTILDAVEQTVVRIMSDNNFFPDKFVTVLRKIDSSLSLKFSIGTIVIGGLLFLRLVNPAVIFPQDYGFVEKRN